MFRYLEILVLNNQINILQNITYDVYNSFNSEELKLGLNNIQKPLNVNLVLKLLILITDLLKKGDILSAHKILIKSFVLCRDFDYSIIFYLRYILYLHIKENEKKTYNENLLLGYLLPFEYYDDDNFYFERFYQNNLLKFYSSAEQITIYLTPFVLGIPLNVIMLKNKGNKKQTFKWENEKGLNLTDEITILFNGNHYEIAYTKNDSDKIDKIYKNNFSENGDVLGQNQEKSKILNNIKEKNNVNFDEQKNEKINKQISSDNKNSKNENSEKSVILNDIKEKEKNEENMEEKVKKKGEKKEVKKAEEKDKLEKKMEDKVKENNKKKEIENVNLNLKQKEKNKENCCDCF